MKNAKNFKDYSQPVSEYNYPLSYLLIHPKIYNFIILTEFSSKFINRIYTYIRHLQNPKVSFAICQSILDFKSFIRHLPNLLANINSHQIRKFTTQYV